MTRKARPDAIEDYLVVWTAIEAAGGPSHMARVWGMTVRRAIGFHTGERKLSKHRRQELTAELRRQAQRCLRLAARLEKPTKR